MKKFFIFAVAAALAMAACSSSQKKESPTEPAEVVEVNDTESYASDAVVTATNDSIYRPGMKVDMPTIIDFNATWCGPCLQFKPIFHAAADKFTNVRFVSVDTDICPATATAFGISAIPTIVFISLDGTQSSVTGFMDAEEFYPMVEKLAGK